MRTKETQVEVIAHFSKEQKEPIPLRVKAVENGETVVIKVGYVKSVKNLTYDCLQYECCSLNGDQLKTFSLLYWIKDMEWHVNR